MKASNIYILLLFIIIISSCSSPSAMEYPEYIKWVNENTVLEKTKKIDPFIYSARYIPFEYIIAKNVEMNSNYNKESIDSLTEGLSHFISFIFKINPVNGSTTPLKYNITSNEEFSERLQYCSFGISDDFYLTIGKDTLKCIDSHLIQEYELRPYNLIVVNFENDIIPPKNYNEDMTLVYEDNLWGNGIIKFKFKNTDIKKVPLLKY